MRRSINLLPTERKKSIEIDSFNRFIFKIGFIMVFAIFLLAIFLFSNLFIIDIYKKINQDEMSIIESEELNSIIQEVKTEIDNHYSKTNQSVTEINQRIPYWDYLIQINQLLPENVYYSQITMEAGKIKLEGLAKNRNDLVSFKESLKQVEIFNEVDMPISNFTSQENVNFEIELGLDKK